MYNTYIIYITLFVLTLRKVQILIFLWQKILIHQKNVYIYLAHLSQGKIDLML